MKNKYGDTALAAVKLIKNRNPSDPRMAWEKAIIGYYESGSSSAKKGCPRDTFLGLCMEGKIKGIPKGNYTRSKKNKKYGLDAISILEKEPILINNIHELWDMIPDRPKTHNGQMNVVVSLFLIKVIVL